jgi:Protein of unknown function (DUF3574)
VSPRRAAWALVLLAAFSGCTRWSATPSAAVVAAATLPSQWLDRLYFGRAQPDGTEVSEQAWADFLRDVVTPRFPHGLTVLSGQGQWRDAAGRIGSERSFVIELVHADSALETADVRAIVAAYKQRFNQESVMWLRQAVQATY